MFLAVVIVVARYNACDGRLTFCVPLEHAANKTYSLNVLVLGGLNFAWSS